MCAYMCAKWLQLCLTLCHPMDCSLPESSVHGIFQARIMKWVAMTSSRRSSKPRDQTCVFYVSCIDRQVLFHWQHWSGVPLPSPIVMSAPISQFIPPTPSLSSVYTFVLCTYVSISAPNVFLRHIPLHQSGYQNLRAIHFFCSKMISSS